MSTRHTATVRRVLRPDGLPPAPGWSHGVQAGGWVFGGSMMATDYATGLLPGARPPEDAPWFTEPLDLESAAVLDATGAVLAEAGGDLRRDLLRVWQWIAATYPGPAEYAASRSHWPALPSGTPYARNLARRVGDPLRASTGIGVRQLPVPGALLALDFIAVPGTGGRKSGVTLPPDLPAPRAGYAPAVRHGDWVFLSGFGATDFAGDWMSTRHMGEPSMIAPEARVNPYIWLGSEIEAQTRYTLDVLARIAESAGTSLDRCVKADVTLTHPADFPGMDRVWREFFGDEPPARTVVTGSQLVIKGLRVEVALVLLAGDATTGKRTVHADEVPDPPGHAPQAVHAGDFLFTSTVLPASRAGAVPAAVRDSVGTPYFADPARAQTALLAEYVAALCQAAGSALGEVCKVQAFLSDLRHLPGMLASWRDAFPTEPPALSSVGLGGGAPLPLPGACVQWDVIAHAPVRGW
ncbi:enamine deaminase RidA (YjgF/YER057c/UK114 family) [Prauserella shujinwangii]|uniref:Enamine deaminase RidA (YjgF/YER057c/UK114 family) n=1 Tax=Prauserella shujinwangii TaxID=1453103 RepID=A0A2T0LSM3_9PSEU|nr:RidA family protein [Prauserella shujinwangii]PRX46622.1 enamine deaminase RidA (YjgF/YER057c/UK114 family) [Prauserella shujinwangii]